MIGWVRRTPQWARAALAAAGASAVVVAVALGSGNDGSVATADPGSMVTPSTAPPAATAGGPSRPGRRSDTTTTASTDPTTPPTAALTSPPATAPATAVDAADEYELEVADNPVVARPVPSEQPAAPPPPPPEPPWWRASTRDTPAGVATDVGCATDLGAGGLDAFFARRVGPVIGWDYQHVTPLGGDRYLWLFQDTFIDHSGGAGRLDQASFVHNTAMVQTGACFTLLHGGDALRPAAWEAGDGSATLRRWFWPMGGDSDGTTAWVFWAEMAKDAYDPNPPDGLGWHPVRTWIATYDAATLERRDFRPAPDSGVAPIYGYAVDSDDEWSYLFGNSFEQNMVREGGFWNGPHSATKIWLARVPRFEFGVQPEYRTADGWSPDPGAAVPIVDRFYAENPMQPRLLGDQWVSATAVDGYWGEHYAIDVADDPWGPWHTVAYAPLIPRGNDPLMNTYHAHVLPWRDSYGSAVIAVSNNARDMLRHAWPAPHRYRPVVFWHPFTPTPEPAPPEMPPPEPPVSAPATLPPPPTDPPPDTTSTTVAPTTVASNSTTTSAAPTTSTTVPPATTSTTVAPATSVLPTSTSTSTSTSAPPGP